MILGICGLAGVGKDTSADHLVVNHDFTKVALADPLKRIARDVYAFTDEQLWGPSAMRNGPDKRYLREVHERHDWLLEATADRGEEWRCDRCGLLGKEQTDDCRVYLTPRFALQLLGTEWGRRCYSNTWVDYTLRLAKELLSGTKEYDRVGGLQIPSYKAHQGIRYSEYNHRTKGVVISDVRFMNEIDAIHHAGGRVIRVTRPTGGLEGAAGQHVSEKEQMSISDSLFDAVIPNDSTIEALCLRLDVVLRAGE